MASVDAWIATPKLRGTSDGDRRTAVMPKPLVGACASRRRAQRFHQVVAVRCEKRKLTYVTASVPSETPSQRTRFVRIVPSSAMSRQLFSCVVQRCDRSERMTCIPTGSKTLARSCRPCANRKNPRIKDIEKISTLPR